MSTKYEGLQMIRGFRLAVGCALCLRQLLVFAALCWLVQKGIDRVTQRMEIELPNRVRTLLGDTVAELL